MKLRGGNVSNSSSSSFVINDQDFLKIKREELRKERKKKLDHIFSI